MNLRDFRNYLAGTLDCHLSREDSESILAKLDEAIKLNEETIIEALLGEHTVPFEEDFNSNNPISLKELCRTTGINEQRFKPECK